MSRIGIEVARTPAELEALREAWEVLPVANPAADPDHLLTLIRHSPEPLRPHVILLVENGRPGALAVGRAGAARLEARFGYQTILRPRVDALIVSQGGIVGAEDGHAEALLPALLDALRHDSLDVVRLRLRVGSPLHRLATTTTGRLVRGSGGDALKRWRARVPETYDEYLRARSGKTRSNVQRYGRRLEERFGDGLHLRVFQSPEELPELVADSRAVYEKTYQHGLSAGLVDDEMEEALRALAAERGWLRGFVLYLEGAPRAFWHGNLYRRTFYTGATGYDPEYRDLRLGTYVLSKMAHYLCGQADWIDFGLGDAEYKRHFGDESWDEENVLLFARRPRPIAVNLSRSAVLGASRAAKGVLAKSGRLDDARRRWRERLAGGDPGR